MHHNSTFVNRYTYKYTINSHFMRYKNSCGFYVRDKNGAIKRCSFSLRNYNTFAAVFQSHSAKKLRKFKTRAFAACAKARLKVIL